MSTLSNQQHRRIILAAISLAVALLAAAFICAPQAHAKAVAAPARATVASVSSEQPGQAAVKLAKVKGAKGYRVELSTAKKFSSASRYDLESAKASRTSVAFNGLKAGTTYYVRARAYSKSGSTTKWGRWSATKTVAVKTPPDIAGELAEAKAGLDSAQAELASAKAQLDSTRNDLAAAERELADAQSENAVLKAELASAKADNERLAAELAEAKSATPAPTPSPAPAPSPAPSSGGDTAVLQAEIARLQAALADAQARLGERPATITYVLDGGKLPDGAKTSVAAEDGEYALPEPSKAGHDFVGWYTATEGGERVEAVSQAGGNATVYARWTAMELFYAYVDAGRTSPDDDMRVFDDATSSYVPLKLYELYIGAGADAPEPGAAYRGGTVAAVASAKDASLAVGSVTLLADAELGQLDLPDMRQCTAIDLKKADTSKASSFEGLFSDIRHIEELDLSTWDTSSLTDLTEAFVNDPELESLNLAGWDFSKCPSVDALFNCCPSLKSIDATGWKLPRDCSYLFNDEFNEKRPALAEVKGTSTWDTSLVENASRMFEGCISLQGIDASAWDLKRLRNASYMFASCRELEAIGFADGALRNLQDASAMFAGCSSLTTVDLAKAGASNVTDASGMFRGMWYDDDERTSYCTSLTTVKLPAMPGLEDASWLFSGCSALESLDALDWGTESLTAMPGAFENCSSLSTLDVSGWDTSHVTDMSYMFHGCASLDEIELPVNALDSVQDLDYCFEGCTGLTSIDLSGQRPASLRRASGLFQGCTSLATADLSGWDTSQLLDCRYIFHGCTALESIDISDWNLAPSETRKALRSWDDEGDNSHIDEVDTDGSLFRSCSGLKTIKASNLKAPRSLNSFFSQSDRAYHFPYEQPSSTIESIIGLDSWDTSATTDMSSAFSGCASLSSLDLSSWDTANATSMSGMLDGCTGLESLKTGAGWSYDALGEYDTPDFPVRMQDEVSTIYEACDAIPQGAHDYTSVSAG